MRKLSFATLPGYLWTGFLTISLETFGVSPVLNFISHLINEFIINEFIYKPKHYITKNYFQITIIIIYSLTSYRTISYVHCFIVCILQSMLKGLRSPLNHKLLGPLLNWEDHPSSFYILPAPRLPVFLFVCMFAKNQINQSEDEIYCHNSWITLLIIPGVFFCWLIQLYIQDIHTFNVFVFFLCSRFWEAPLYFTFGHNGSP